MYSWGRYSFIISNTTRITAAVAVIALLLLSSLPLDTSSPIGPTGAGEAGSRSSPGPLNTDPPIVIDSDANLATHATANGWPGDGTVGDPFVISGLLINGTEARYCIHVRDVSAHLVISENHLVNASYKPGEQDYPTEAGIRVERCGNITIRDNRIENMTRNDRHGGIGVWVDRSTARIEGNTIVNVQNGILITRSHVEIVDNNILDTVNNGIRIGLETSGRVEGNLIKRPFIGWYYAKVGIRSYSGFPLSVAKNTIGGYYNGIDDGGTGHTFRDNNVTECKYGMTVTGTNGTYINNTFKVEDRGLILSRATNATYRDNILVGCFVYVYDGDWFSIVEHDLDASNTIEGHPILLWYGVKDREVPKGRGQLVLSYCENITMRDEEADRPWAGIIAGHTRDLTVSGVDIASTFKAQILLHRSEDYRVSNCSFENISLESTAERYGLNHSCRGTFSDNLLVNGFIRTRYVANTTISGNTVRSDYHQGIAAAAVASVTIVNNDVTTLYPASGSSAIGITTIGSSRVSGNTLHRNGFEIGGNETQMRSLDFLDDNTLDGKPVIYRRDTISQVYRNDYSQVILVGCIDFTIEDLNVTTGNIGVILGFCKGGTVRNCTFNGPTYNGIRSQGCDKITVIGCTFIEGHHSIESKQATNLTIKDNEFYSTVDHTIIAYEGAQVRIEGNIIIDCGWRGIYIVAVGDDSYIVGNYIANCTEHAIQHSGPVNIWHNTFVDNALNSAYKDGSDGQCGGSGTWDDGTRGNYWSDYEERYPHATNDGVTWSEPYHPSGSNPVIDNHPLVHGWDIFPPVAHAGADQEVDEGTEVTLSASDSTDNMGIASYQWSFEYDGSDVVLNGEDVQFTFDIVGEYEVTLKVTDVGGLLDVDSLIVKVLDRTPPGIIVYSPVDDELTRNATYNVSGLTEPFTQVDIRVDSKEDTRVYNLISSEDGTFEVSVDLFEGIQIVMVTATDAVGNPTVVTRLVTLDTIPPDFIINSPDSDYVLTNLPRYTITGTMILDPEAQVWIQIYRVAHMGLFQHEVELEEGENLIEVKAVDKAGNEKVVVLTIVRDTISPVLTVTAPPEDFLITNDLTVHFAGTVRDAAGVVIQHNALDLAALLVTGTWQDGEWEYDLELGPMDLERDVAVIAYDLAGNEAMMVIYIRLDIVPPQLSIDGEALSYTNQTTVTISGTTEELIEAVTVNGVEEQVEGGVFSITVDLDEGTNSIEFSVLDEAGNPASVTIELILDTVPPTFEIDYPKETDKKKATISGTCSNDVVTMLVNGRSIKVENGTYEVEVEIEEDGKNQFIITFEDRAGNTVTETITIRKGEETPGFGGILAVLAMAVSILAALSLRKRR